jgi:hypothetical protein
LSLGIEAKKIPEKAVRTPDYGNIELCFEATTIHPYSSTSKFASAFILPPLWSFCFE